MSNPNPRPLAETADTKPAEAVREWWATLNIYRNEGVIGPNRHIVQHEQNVEHVRVVEHSAYAQAISRVAELERENIGKKFAITTVEAERDSLKAEVERLRAKLDSICIILDNHAIGPTECAAQIREALKVTND